MPARRRLDAELVRRGLARSRDHAARLVSDGRVRVAGRPASKAATAVTAADPILVVEENLPVEYVSRGGHKLAGALDAFAADGLTVAGKRCLDAGASTGGFTDVLLRRGASRVVAVDVGYGQLAWSLRQDDRVSVHERTNVRDISADLIGGPVDLVVADLSFISLTLVLGALVSGATAGADFVLMVKPQFEVGRERVGKGGVVRDPAVRAAAVRAVADAAAAHGLGVRGVIASALPGPAGNVEYFVWLRSGAPPLDPAALDRAVEQGPT
ncbi:MAG TPA: TlyA family RNA methyltransferase [Jiangellales bacterium]|nr:TlyA family RNA methyltransferase [Jiangellales bacterium]